MHLCGSRKVSELGSEWRGDQKGRQKPDQAGPHGPTARSLSSFFVLLVAWQRIWHKVGGQNRMS